MQEFHTTVKGVLEIMEGQAKRIEREKLKVCVQREALTSSSDSVCFLWYKAIGQRNRVDNEIENRNRQKLMLEVLIKEKQTELER